MDLGGKQADQIPALSSNWLKLNKIKFQKKEAFQLSFHRAGRQHTQAGSSEVGGRQ